jgi:hypothetical protein
MFSNQKGHDPLKLRVRFEDSKSEKPPRYRIEREASEERAWQQLVNIFRRLAGLRIKRTGQQAHEHHLKQAVRP